MGTKSSHACLLSISVVAGAPARGIPTGTAGYTGPLAAGMTQCKKLRPAEQLDQLALENTYLDYLDHKWDMFHSFVELLEGSPIRIVWAHLCPILGFWWLVSKPFAITSQLHPSLGIPQLHPWPRKK